MDFGRQPLPVTIEISGALEDVLYWQREFERRAEFKGDVVIRRGDGCFNIYPSAVND